MANEILQKVGTQICFCIVGELSPADPATDLRIGAPTTVALTLNALANAAGRQSLKADLGATRAAAYEVLAAVDFTGETPTQGGRFDFYWAPSTHGTQANGNVAGNSGADAAAPDGALGGLTLADFIALCQPIGSLPIHDGVSVQNGFVGVFCPTTRYGQLVAVNNSGDALEADDVENHVVLTPIVDEVQ